MDFQSKVLLRLFFDKIPYRINIQNLKLDQRMFNQFKSAHFSCLCNLELTTEASQRDGLCCGSSRRAAGKTLMQASKKLPRIRKQRQATGRGLSRVFDIKQNQTYIASTVSVKTKSCCRQPSSSQGDTWTSFANTSVGGTLLQNLRACLPLGQQERHVNAKAKDRSLEGVSSIQTNKQLFSKAFLGCNSQLIGQLRPTWLTQQNHFWQDTCGRSLETTETWPSTCLLGHTFNAPCAWFLGKASEKSLEPFMYTLSSRVFATMPY